MKRALFLGGLALTGAVLANAGVTYTCDPTINATVAGLCNTLNTTTAALYNNTFSNATANIYITFGTTGLGSSAQYLNFVPYSQYIAAATKNASGSSVQTAAAAALKAYAAPIYSSGQVEISSALGLSLGFTGMTGTTSAGNPCDFSAAGCYAAIITITNDPTTVLYYRTGTEPKGAYDFFSTVEHETDEVLGTSSCINTQAATLSDSCGNGVPAAIDLFRYSAAGKLVSDASLSTTPGAYFSYDGGVTNPAPGVFFNTLSNGDDYADLLGPCPGTQYVQNAEGCPGHDGNTDITNDGGIEIDMLNALGYSLTATASGVPSINPSGVVTSGTTLTTIEPGSWVAIYGSNLSTTSRSWTSADIVNGNLPTSLSGVSVKINNKPAYVYYISPTQINVQAPDDTATGSVSVTVTNASGTSAASTVTLASVSPAFFTLDGKYAAGVIPASTGYYLAGTASAYDLLGPTGKFAYNTRPVKKGELLELYMTGFGVANPTVPAGIVYSSASQAVAPVSLSVGGVVLNETAYVVGAGLYQMNVTIPANVASGDNALTAIVNGVQTPTGIYITVQ